MRHILVLVGFLFLSQVAHAEVPFKSISFAFKNDNNLGFKVSNFEGFDGTQVESFLSFSETEHASFSNFVFNKEKPNCTKESNKISCELKFKAFFPKCAYTDGMSCDQNAVSEIQNLTLNFNLEIDDQLSVLDFSGTLVPDSGEVFPLDIKDFRNYTGK